jgi:hypothetical protein
VAGTIVAIATSAEYANAQGLIGFADYALPQRGKRTLNPTMQLRAGG